MSGAEFAAQIYKADLLEMNGSGGRLYGDGIYVASSAWDGGKLRTLTDIGKHNARHESLGYGDTDCGILEMTFTRKPKIILQSDLKKMWDKLTPEQQVKYGKHENTYACVLGYDAMYCDGPKYMVIWNRSIIAVKKK